MTIALIDSANSGLALRGRQISTFALFCAAMNQATQKTIEMNVQNKIKSMTMEARIAAAKEKLPRVVEHFLYLLALHENNAIIVNSPRLASQIPQSRARKAFRVFQSGLHQFEIIRLCALWDSVDLAKENIPTVIELIDHPEIIEALARETEMPSAGLGASVAKTRHALRKAISNARTIAGSVTSLRDKHALPQTRRARQAVPALRYGDQPKLLEKSLVILETLYCRVNGTGINFAESRESDRRNAKGLWEACTFDIKY